MEERQLRVCLSKIFNWQGSQKIVPMLIQFKSIQVNQTIARKSLKATLINNYLQINVHLKIKYTAQENQILILLCITDYEGRKVEDVGEVAVNLEEVLARKIKYYTLGDGDKVLQVQVSENMCQQKQVVSGMISKDAQKKKNQKFLQDRRKFLENVSQTQRMLKRAFSQKIMSLLNDDLNEGASSQGEQSNNPPTHLEDYRKNQIDLESIHSGDMYSKDLNKKLMKSTSDNGMRFGRDNARQINFDSHPQQNQYKIGSRSTHSQKHKLILNTLNIVPEKKNEKRGF